MLKIIKNIIIFGSSLTLSGVVFVIVLNFVIYTYSKNYIYDDIEKIPGQYTAIVLGAKVMPSGNLSHIMYDRAISAVELYKNKKVKKILISGDHGTKNYDEVNATRKFMVQYGVNDSDIFTDHAGFDTYSTMVRADKVFCVDNAIIVTQQFHLYRAVFIARIKGIEAYGYSADKRNYLNIRYYVFREKIANIKAFLELLINKRPKYLGEKIPITGDSKKSRG